MNRIRISAIFSAMLFAATALRAQQPATPPAEPPMRVPKVVPIPPLHPNAPAKEPTDPPARDVTDARAHLTFHLPAGWNLSRKDGELSTFLLDARTAPPASRMHLVATLAFNPYPLSTFEGALFYVSSTPRLTAAQCAAQTATKPFEALAPATLDGQPFARGKDEHGKVCTEARDVAYTAMRENSCLRFDLAINSFCGGEVSGAQDLTEGQLQALYTRLVTILDSVRFTKK
jgi:hypothetical protein